MDEFRDEVKRSFAACREDIESLKDENSKLKSDNEKLVNSVSELTSEIKELKELILSQRQKKVSEPDVAPANVAKQSDPYEALLAFKAKSNKREMLKQKMISMITENGMNLAELKFMFVEHYRYCSKATFYNYLKELELERVVKIERENSKNIIYPIGMRKEV